VANTSETAPLYHRISHSNVREHYFFTILLIIFHSACDPGKFPWKPYAHSINNMAGGEALQDILRASATFHTQSLDLSKKNIETLPEDFPVLQNLLVSCILVRVMLSTFIECVGLIS